VFLRRYRKSRCLVFLNKGPRRRLTVRELEIPDGEHTCLLSGRKLRVQSGATTVTLEHNGAIVLAVRGRRVRAQTVIRVQVNGAPTRPGDRLAVIGDSPELGNWDLTQACELECVNSNTWFGELPFNESSGKAVGYKYVIFPPDPKGPPRRESRIVRRRLVTPDESAKWRDRWED
jgi:cyclomaltodextrin glucanotransferase